MKFLFLFMDGVGLGENDPQHNPFAKIAMPNLEMLLGGNKLIKDSAGFEGQRATLLAIDANLGVDGLPQSATGQGALVTGKNISEMVGEHYGPKPNEPVRQIIKESNLFISLQERGYTSALLNGYPPRYFQGIESGKRLLSSIPLALTSAGIPLKTEHEMLNGDALSVDFTGKSWREQLGYTEYPVMAPRDAGKKLADLSLSYDLAFFEFWISDYVGHHQDHEAATFMLENFDLVLGGLLENWQDEQGLILITSDHGNMEDLSIRKHTFNPVPALLIGNHELRRSFVANLSDISEITPAILQFYPPISST